MGLFESNSIVVGMRAVVKAGATRIVPLRGSPATESQDYIGVND